MLKGFALSRLGAAVALGAGLGTAACAYNTADVPQTYLRQAQQAVEAHDAPRALAALDKAEALWVGGNTAFTDPFFDYNPEALRQMARARQSIQLGRWGDAEYYVAAARTHPSTLTEGQ